jgi:thiol:disulfide interchange protein DsbD
MRARWFSFHSALLLAAAFAIAPRVASAQDMGATPPPAESLVVIKAAPVTVAAGSRADATLRLTIAPGWHINANPPSPDYMIASEVTLTPSAGIRAGKPSYPPGQKLKVSFDESAISVFSGTVTVSLPISAAAGAAPGAHTLQGHVRFQSCNDQLCLAPASVSFEVPLTVTAGAAGGTTAQIDTATSADTSTESAQGFATAPPPGGGTTATDPVHRALAMGGWAWFLALFAGGLLLNFTPCVFPMIGITVSIFGARQKEPVAKVFTHATAYVLGIIVMYSALGLFAGLSGSLFGSVLQNAWVPIATGVLLIVLSASMFGAYEFQAPLWLMSRLGGSGTTSLAGLFVSGLGVGIIAAPCVGPFVTALLLVIAQRRDALFGLQAMLVLSLGLGAPYLVLATFSNLLQALPRSGEWMVWVKKLFGVTMLELGAFYLAIGIAPRVSGWVLPIGLGLGGLYLGFIAPGPGLKPGFRRFARVAGAGAILAAGVIVALTPPKGLTFQELTPDRLDAARKAGRPVMLDFSADWCVPCHELERSTFTDKQVVIAARDFATFKVDLTRYHSPEAERARRDYGVAGVPTVVFLAADGREVRAARVVGFLPPQRFLERMKLVGMQEERAARP